MLCSYSEENFEVRLFPVIFNWISKRRNMNYGKIVIVPRKHKWLLGTL